MTLKCLLSNRASFRGESWTALGEFGRFSPESVPIPILRNRQSLPTLAHTLPDSTGRTWPEFDQSLARHRSNPGRTEADHFGQESAKSQLALHHCRPELNLGRVFSISCASPTGVCPDFAAFAPHRRPAATTRGRRRAQTWATSINVDLGFSIAARRSKIGRGRARLRSKGGPNSADVDRSRPTLIGNRPKFGESDRVRPDSGDPRPASPDVTRASFQKDP